MCSTIILVLMLLAGYPPTRSAGRRAVPAIAGRMAIAKAGQSLGECVAAQAHPEAEKAACMGKPYRRPTRQNPPATMGDLLNRHR
jgi:hypothetical protein